MLDRLIAILSEERGELPPTNLSEQQKRNYFRALCNVRPPKPVTDEFLTLHNAYLQALTQERGVVDVKHFDYHDGIALWQGDITRLNSDAIVNAGNAALLGCFQPLHSCIDNIIHSNAGVQVRLECDRIMQGKQLSNGDVRVTTAANLPGRYIVHTVGPIVQGGHPSAQDQADLADCYRNSVRIAHEMDLETLSLCCISTGLYGYPKAQAAALAVTTVRAYLPQAPGLKVIFNVYLDEDKEHYERELSK